MKIIKRLFNILFGSKERERQAIERTAQMREQEMIENYNREIAKAVAKTKEDELLKRMRTYNKPVVVTKAVTVTPCAEAITDKQETFIKVIETGINKYYGYRKVQFRGATKREASAWIGANVKEFRRIENLARATR